MLSGIKVGKKKKKAKKTHEPSAPSARPDNDTSVKNPENDNQSVAERLRNAIASGKTSVLEDQSASRVIGRLESLPVAAENSSESTLVVSSRVRSTDKREEDMTAAELAMNERNMTMSWDEQMVRNAIRTGKKRKNGRGEIYEQVNERTNE